MKKTLASGFALFILLFSFSCSRPAPLQTNTPSNGWTFKGVNYYAGSEWRQQSGSTTATISFTDTAAATHNASIRFTFKGLMPTQSGTYLVYNSGTPGSSTEVGLDYSSDLFYYYPTNNGTTIVTLTVDSLGKRTLSLPAISMQGSTLANPGVNMDTTVLSAHVHE